MQRFGQRGGGEDDCRNDGGRAIKVKPLTPFSFSCYCTGICKSDRCIPSGRTLVFEGGGRKRESAWLKKRKLMIMYGVCSMLGSGILAGWLCSAWRQLQLLLLFACVYSTKSGSPHSASSLGRWRRHEQRTPRTQNTNVPRNVAPREMQIRTCIHEAECRVQSAECRVQSAEPSK